MWLKMLQQASGQLVNLSSSIERKRVRTMRLKKIFSVLLLIIAFLSSPAYSQKVGSTSMQFLKVTPSARGTAVGDAYSVWATGADALFWNPSGITSVANHDFAFTYIQWIFDTRQGAFSYATNFGDYGSVGFQLQYVDFGEIIEAVAVRPYINTWPDPGITGNTFRPFSYLIGVTYASSLTDRFCVGGSVKYAHESLYNGSRVMAQINTGVMEEVKTWANGLMFDFGFRYNTGFKSIQIGASVQNFGANVTYAKESHPLPMMFRWGIAGNVIGKDAMFGYDETHRIAVAFDLFQPNDYSQQEHVGVEYEYDGTFALRAGYKFNYDSEGITLGAGIKQTVDAFTLSFDYAFGSMGPYLGNVHRFSLGVGL